MNPDSALLSDGADRFQPARRRLSSPPPDLSGRRLPRDMSRPVKSDRYGYATGRIRAMENHLLDADRLNRLLDARSLEDVSRILQESGYPGGDPETSLRLELAALFTLQRQLLPEPRLLDVFLLFHDCHNLKVCLKYLAANWLSQPAPESGAPPGQLPESPPSLLYSAVEPLMLQPALVQPDLLFRAIRDRQPELVLPWLYQLALAAVAAWQSRYDLADLDILIDRTAYQLAIQSAAPLACPFLTDYLRLRIDLVNLEILLRSQPLRQDEAYLQQTLLSGGSLAIPLLLEWYALPRDQLAVRLTATPFASLAPVIVSYGQHLATVRFGRLADQLILRHLAKARQVLRGPEVPLAYLLNRSLEIRTVRMVLAGLRHGWSSARIRELVLVSP